MGRHRKSYDDAYIAAIPAPKSGRKRIPDSDQRGLYINITPKGSRSFVVVKQVAGKQSWVTLVGVTGIEAARSAARGEVSRIAAGLPKPIVIKPDSFRDVADNWFKREVEKEGHRSASYVRANIDNHIFPAWGDQPFEAIGRSDIAKLLDRIEDKVGASAADKVLNIVSRITNWYAARHDSYRSPVVRGMRRISTKEQARDRILNDDELRAIWKTAAANGQFGAFIRLLLLTGQRREKVAAMKWADIEDGVWAVPSEAREKGNIDRVKLPPTAVGILASISHVDGNPFVFAASRSRRKEEGKAIEPTHISAFSKPKTEFDKKSGVAGWVLHDLRRTARSLLARAGVSSEHAERVLGHAIRGVEGTYDRHRYEQEKASALRKLAGLIELIVNPPAENVVRIAG